MDRKRLNKFTQTTLPPKYLRSKKILAILSALHPDTYGMLTTEQIYMLCFPKGSKSYCNDILKYMFHKPLQLVNRHSLYERGLNNTIVYTITNRGSRLLHAQNAGRIVTSNKAYKIKNSTLLYREHEKGLNDVRIAITKGAKSIGATIETWISDRDFKQPRIRKQLRVYDQKKGEAFGFQPDGFFVLKLATGELKPFFLEYDNNTTFHKRFGSIKIRGYHLLGDLWRKLPVFAPYKDIPVTYRVLTVTNAGIDRAFHLKEKSVEALFKNDKQKEQNTKRFYFTQSSLVIPETIFIEPIWFVPFKSKRKEEKIAIFEKEK